MNLGENMSEAAADWAHKKNFMEHKNNSTVALQK